MNLPSSVHLSAEPMEWEQAKEYAESLDLRLPSMEEVAWLSQHNWLPTNLGCGWTNSEAHYPDFAFCAYLCNGEAHAAHKVKRYNVVCVPKDFQLTQEATNAE